MPTPGEGGGERGNVDVLAARVDAPQRGERAGVLRHHRDLHSATGSSPATVRSPARQCTAATTSAASIVSRQGWPGTGQVRARDSRHGAFWSPRTTDGTPQGAQRSAGTTGAKS